jgi:hypothetical protein
MMRRAVRFGLLAVLLSVAAPSVRSQTTPQQPHLGRVTWYEALLKTLNPTHTNYGDLIEKRRQALLDASMRNPYFWYCLCVSVYATFGTLAFAKYVMDVRRERWAHAQVNADIRNHDLHSREKAREAIERYNNHIEECNRAIEAAESGDGRPGWGDSAVENLKAELQRVAAQLDATSQERNKLQEELRQKALVVTDLSLRLDALAKKMNGQGDPRAGVPTHSSTDLGGDGARFVGHINRLQEELYAERQRNKHLKGA